MRRAMAEAEVGDDVFHEDPTVTRLEEETAAVLGKEGALFVPTGSMGNEIAVAIQTKRGDALLLHRHSHIVYTEAAAITQLLERRFHLMDGDRGRLRPEDVVAALESGDGGSDGIALVEVEQTQNWGSGALYPLPRLTAVSAAARARRLPVHLDGARVWNASAATGISPATYAAVADTVMVCFSKGLGAPIGSALAGTKEAIQEARGVRRMFGGGMRQVGIIAAGASYALRHNRERLAEDHRRARRLAEAIAEIPGIKLDPSEIDTNIVIAEIEEPHERIDAFVAAVEADGVRLYLFGGPGRFRAATHLDVDDAGVDRAIAAIRAAAASILGKKR
jgi:threonine aldolase